MDGDTLKNVSAIISNLGFPVFVAVWLLVRTDKVTRDLTAAIRELTRMIDQHKWRE